MHNGEGARESLGAAAVKPPRSLHFGVDFGRSSPSWGGTVMRIPQSRLALALSFVAVLIVASAATAAVGLSTGVRPVRHLGPPPRVAPQIVKFYGPSVVRCRKAGDAVRVKYKYATIHASAVKGRIDGVRRGVRRAGSPARGTMRFRYVCDGPHTIAIIARSPTGATASSSIRFNKKNRAVSATASSEISASP